MPGPPLRTTPGRAEIARTALLFAVLTAVVTWPLARDAATRVAGDLGDPLFTAWAMAWVQDHLSALLAGDLGAFSRMWDAPIFAPEPLALAFSEHFTGQALLTLPVAWLGGSPIAVFSAAVLASFWLSALGAWLFVRVLTGHRVAALVTGICFGVDVYRASSLAHLHTISTQWVPFVLAGLLIFARTGSRPALAGATLAYVATAWSSIYLLAFFSPFIGAFAILVLALHDGWRTPGAAAAMAVAAAVTVALVTPFLWPYAEVQRTLQVIRASAEVESYSQSIEDYLEVTLQLAPMAALAALSLAALSPRASGLRAHVVFFAAMAALAVWLSLGPVPRWDGVPLLVPGLYGVLFDHVPGFSALRVPARFTMVLMLALSVLAGLGVAVVAQRSRRLAVAASAIGIALHLAMYWRIPLPFDVPIGTEDLRPIPSYLSPTAPPTALDRALAAAAPEAMVVELPLGEPAYDLRYMYRGRGHGLRLLNGYSGVFPRSYGERQRVLRRPWLDPDAAWQALRPATFVAVHAEAWAPQDGEAVRDWLRGHGAVEVAVDYSASLWRLPPWPPPR